MKLEICSIQSYEVIPNNSASTFAPLQKCYASEVRECTEPLKLANSLNRVVCCDHCCDRGQDAIAGSFLEYVMSCLSILMCAFLYTAWKALDCLQRTAVCAVCPDFIQSTNFKVWKRRNSKTITRMQRWKLSNALLVFIWVCKSLKLGNLYSKPNLDPIPLKMFGKNLSANKYSFAHLVCSLFAECLGTKCLEISETDPSLPTNDPR